MDIDGDGATDILSGSYSRMDGDMAGLFFVLKGGKDGFAPAKSLEGSDGKPLIIPVAEGQKDGDVIRICTRPFAVDLNGDGHLDIVSGNFEGTFYVFDGLGKGQFRSTATQIQQGQEALRVRAHSDPFFIDWDRDGDMDLLSGSASGGVTLFMNTGSAKSPEFGAGVPLVKAQNDMHEANAAEASGGKPGPIFGDAHVKGPQDSTRVWVDDLNGDGKWDLLVGDAVQFEFPAEGLDEATAAKRLKAWDKEFAELQESMDWENEEDSKKFSDFYETREKIIRTERTGQVWIYYQK